MTDYAWDEAAYSDYDQEFVFRGNRRGFLGQPIQEDDKKMKTVQDLQAERDEALQRADELAKVIEQREKMGTDPFKNGAILKVEMRYPPSRTTYTYAVIKIAGRFWLTGKMQQRDGVLAELDGKRNGWSWENFIAWLAQGDASVWQAQNLEQIF